VAVGLVLVLAVLSGRAPAASASSVSVTVTATVRSCLVVEVVPLPSGTVLVVRTNCRNLLLLSEDGAGGLRAVPAPQGVSVHPVSSSWTVIER
jgi:hypothetical protein